MINASKSYKNAMDKMLRNRIHIAVNVGIINNDAQNNSVIEDDSAYWSYGSPFVSGNNNEYATLETNYMKLDGSMLFVPEESNDIQLKKNGFVSKDPMQSILIKFKSVYSIKGITIDFGSSYPTRFNLETDYGTYGYWNDNSIFISEDAYGDITFIKIVPVEMLGGDKRLRIKKILMGVGLRYTNKQTKSFHSTEDISPISAEIPSQTVNYTFYDRENDFDVDNDNSFIDYMDTLQTVSVDFGIELNDGIVDWNRISTTYLKDWKSQNGVVSLSASDRLSFLDETYTLGNRIYSRTAYEEAVNILSDAGLSVTEYFVDDYLKTLTFFNPIPEGTHKESLQILANASRCKIRADENGRIIIEPNFATILDRSEIMVSTNGVAEWGNEKNIITGADVVYAELLSDFMRTDGSMYFMPEDKLYKNTGYVSEAISNSDGSFDIEPEITLSMTAAYSYHGLSVVFGGNTPNEINVKTYNGNTKIFESNYMITGEIFKINETFEPADKIVLRFTKGAPNNRIIVNQVILGSLSDYVLKKKHMLENPIGYKEKRVKEIKIKIYSFAENEDGIPVEVEDEVYYTKQLNLVGTTKIISNPLISNTEQAALIAEWIGNYYSNNISYTAKYRGEPILNASDIIRMESKNVPDLQVEILRHEISFNGALSGNLELRKAVNMTGG